MQKNIILYHKNCPDGSTSAAIAYKKFGAQALYFPCSYDDSLPTEVLNIDNKGTTNIYILDFSFAKDILDSLEKDFLSLTILDHHASSQGVVESMSGGHFDNNMSGASLSWQYFFDAPIPKFIKIIETIDLFKDTHNELEDITAYINSLDYSIETYVRLLDTFDALYDKYRQEGASINRYVGLLEDMTTKGFDVVEFEGVRMPAVNMTFDINTKSRILAKLYKTMPPVAMSYRYKGGQWKISLRSNGDFDVTTIACKYGGGGHKSAAGCVIDAADGRVFFKLVGKWKDGEFIEADI